MQDVLEAIERWRAQGARVALATVVRTYGSAPRGVGSKLAVSAAGEMAGSVSGGCVEGAVFEECIEALKTGRRQLVRYGISDEQAWGVGLACGGTIEVFVEPLDW
jgi:xanthine/CO dehydrogenase XdhC/CoxF family maturation factor